MKIRLTAIFLILAGFAQADVSIYRGSQVTKTSGPTAPVTQPEKLIQVVDWNTSQVVLIRFGVKDLKKTFTVSEPTPMVVTQVGDGSARNRNNTVLVQASTVVDPDTGDTTVISMLQTGFNAAVPAKADPQPSRPKLLKMEGFRADTNASAAGSGASFLVQLRGAFHLLTAQTVESNTAGEDLAAAVSRVVAGLIADGNVDNTVYPSPTVE
jgi:hypothetical protein